eukprot:CAMPEP_0194303968 /NCGR_PEP_ID=MMETSP0171-20130528/1776_1 /TAXON_ID=218684 /ORGANISM="Corethron pennatum, Strain L29A3" /LENGTH=95 /DNA_ID=CAMNT_0039055055 /DNA_START=110 /DNA_END=394 /DNA_ORIENTATION=+
MEVRNCPGIILGASQQKYILSGVIIRPLSLWRYFPPSSVSFPQALFSPRRRSAPRDASPPSHSGPAGAAALGAPSSNGWRAGRHPGAASWTPHRP